MRSKRVVGIASVATVLLMVMTAFAAVPGAGADEEKFEYVVLFKDSVDAKVIKDNNGKVDQEFTLIPAVVTTMTEKDAKNLEKSDKVKTVEENYKYSVAKPGGGVGKPPKDPPTQPAQVTPWGVDRIDADEAWDTSTGVGITVAVIDTGIDKDHPDLAANIVGGKNYVSIRGTVDASAWDDDNGHGTHCAGIIAALDNTIGVVGVAPNAHLYAVKVLNKRGTGYMSDVIAGIEWAASVDVDTSSNTDYVDVISMSLSGPYSSNLADAVAAAIDAGIVVVAAAGNAGTAPVAYPALCTGVIGVGATDSSDELVYFSNYGTGLDIVAPGVSIYSTYKNGGYTTMSGTSMACPHVAGTVALVLSIDGDVSGIFGNAEWLEGYTTYYYGSGLLDAEAAVA